MQKGVQDDKSSFQCDKDTVAWNMFIRVRANTILVSCGDEKVENVWKIVG